MAPRESPRVSASRRRPVCQAGDEEAGDGAGVAAGAAGAAAGVAVDAPESPDEVVSLLGVAELAVVEAPPEDDPRLSFL